ncbi:MAG: hypothetical protein AAF415_12970 [Pseudomonadota bacterium]
MNNPMEEWPVERIENEKRRAAILRHLMNSTDNECGDQLLAHACRALGITSSPIQIRAAIAYLTEAGLVTRQDFDEIVVVKITKEGKAVARGHMSVPGIMTPTDFD